MRPCFYISNLNKGPFVYRAVASALAQNIPCEVLVTDASSTDNSWDEIQRAVAEAPRGAEHEVKTLQSPAAGSNNFQSFSDHWMWALGHMESQWMLQCSSDDYSLPDRARLCMEAVKHNPCSVIATTMFFETPGVEGRSVSGYPKATGYVDAGEGLLKLAYGSVIAGYKKSFIEKAGGFGHVTPDVFWGYLAALGEGFYVIADPQHVHVRHENVNNLGFQGKMLGATGDKDAEMRLAELNHFQLLRLYFKCFHRARELYPHIKPEHEDAVVNMVLGQSWGWMCTREALHEAAVNPGVMK